MEFLSGVSAMWLVHSLGWTLLHFCWQGAVVAGLLWCVLGWLGEGRPEARYGASLGALGLMVLLPVVTFARLGLEAYRGEMALRDMVPDLGLVVNAVAGGGAAPWWVRGAAAVDGAMPWVLLVWMVGAVVFLVRLQVGFVVAGRLRSEGLVAAPVWVGVVFAGLRERLGVKRAVRLMESAMVQVPTVIGWLKPVVLLPVSCFTGLSDVQVEAILCHELAHIRRHDYLVSVAQGVVEAVLFYQPCVWWVSRQVRRERECCCDRMAVGVGGDRLAYARALSALEARRSFYPEIALGANGGVLTMRIRRLLGMKGTEAHSQVASVALLAMIVVAGGAGIGRLAHAQAGAAPAATVVPDGAARVAPIAGMAQDAETGSAKARVRILKDDPEFKKLPDAEQKRVLDSLKQVRPLTDEELKSIAEAQRLAMTVNSAEFAEQMAKMQVEAQRFNTPEFRKRMADMQAEVAKINTPEFQKQMAEQMRALGEAQGALARQKALEELNSDDFKKQMAAMQAEVAKINTPEFRAQMKAMAAEAAKIDTPEFRKQMDESMRSMRDAQKNMARQTAAMKLGPDAQELAELSANLGAMSRLEDGGGDSSAHGPVQVAGGVMAASVVSQAPPVYPPIAKAAHVSGVVVLRALISKVGTVENLQVVSGPQMLRSSAMDAVKMWTYKPYLLNGEPVEVETTVNVNFSFGDEGPAPSGAVRVSGATMQGMLVSQATPVYPADAKEQHIFGAVVLKAVISKEGTIAGLQVVSGPKELMKSAIDAVKQWTYKPYLLNGEPTEVVTTITVNYSFGGDAAVPGAPAIGPHLAGWLDQHRNLPVDQQIKALESEPGFRELSPEAQRRMRDHLVRLNAMAAGDGGGAAFAPKRVGHGVSAPVPVSMPDPEYTPEARKAKVSGDVLVSLWVDENGIPTHVGVLRGMGNGLDEQAVEAVKKYRFKPAMEDGKPVTVAMNVEVNFKIF